MSGFDAKALRAAFGRFPTGVTVVTARTANGEPVGFTANSFTSVSIDPPLLLVCPGLFLSSFGVFSACSHFGVSILAEGQENISNTFASSKGDRFEEVLHWVNDTGIPLISGAAAAFSCRTVRSVEAGDHTILLGEVLDFVQSEHRGLGYASGQYFSLGLERRVHDAAHSNICGVIARFNDTVLLEASPQGLRPPVSVSPDHASLRESLAGDLARRGVTARLGPVYSVFDNATDGTQHAYLLAAASDVTPDCTLKQVDIADICTAQFTTSAIQIMMRRYAAEARTGNFTLYRGDHETGGAHQLSTGG